MVDATLGSAYPAVGPVGRWCSQEDSLQTAGDIYRQRNIAVQDHKWQGVRNMDGAVTLEQLAAQLNKIEQENARLREAIAALQARQAIGRREGEQPTTPAGAETPRSSRRRVLSTALSAVTAAVGASVVLDAH